MRSSRSGYTLTEMLVVFVVMGSMLAFALPKFATLTERGKLSSARQAIQSAVATARAAAIQKGRSAKVRVVGNALSVTVTTSGAGATTTLIPTQPLDSLYNVTVTATDTVIAYDMRGFTSPRLGATSIYRIIGRTRRDSVCVTVSGQIMPARCSL